MSFIYPSQQRHKLGFQPSRVDSPANSMFSVDWASNEHRNDQSVPQSQSGPPLASGTSNRYVLGKHRGDAGNKFIAQGLYHSCFTRTSLSNSIKSGLSLAVRPSTTVRRSGIGVFSCQGSDKKRNPNGTLRVLAKACALPNGGESAPAPTPRFRVRRHQAYRLIERAICRYVLRPSEQLSE